MRCSPEFFGNHGAVTESRDRQGSREGSFCEDTDGSATLDADGALAAIIQEYLLLLVRFIRR